MDKEAICFVTLKTLKVLHWPSSNSCYNDQVGHRLAQSFEAKSNHFSKAQVLPGI